MTAKRLGERADSSIPPSPELALFHEPFVIPHHQLRFNLLNRIHRDANYDQQRSAAEIKVDAETVENGTRCMRVKPTANRARQMLQVNAAKHEFGHQADNRQIDATNKSEPAQNATDVFGSIASGPYSGNKTAVLAHVVRKLGGIKNNANIKERENDDEHNVNQSVERLAPSEIIRRSDRKICTCAP